MRNGILIFLSLYIGWLIAGDMQLAHSNMLTFASSPKVDALMQVAINATSALVEGMVVIVLWLINVAYTLQGARDSIEKQTYLLGQSSQRITT